MLAELSRLYNAGGVSVIAALMLGSYLLYFLWCALRLWSIDVREHRLPHRILILWLLPRIRRCRCLCFLPVAPPIFGV